MSEAIKTVYFKRIRMEWLILPLARIDPVFRQSYTDVGSDRRQFMDL